jgi:hypothetical protein
MTCFVAFRNELSDCGLVGGEERRREERRGEETRLSEFPLSP